MVVEDFTSTSCGFCPRGIVGKENLRNQFGDLYVGITLHQHSSSDAMYLALDRYASLAFAGAPQCFLDRKQLMDPYNGTGSGICAAFADYQAMPVQVGVEVEASWNQDLSQVNATATVQSLVDGADFNIEYVLIGDGITGTSSGFKQANFYNTYSNLNADLAIFGAGGEYGQSPVTGLLFNDVALSSSYVGGVNQAAKLTNLSSAEPAISQYTLSLPTKAELLNAIDKEQVYVAVLIVDNDGTIANAAKAKVQPFDPTGIRRLTPTLSQGEGAWYTLDGRKLQGQPTLKGVYIHNGNKVVIK